MPELQSLIARSCFARVLLLANADEPAALVEQQPAIAGRVVGFEADHHDVGAIGERAAELADGFGAKERRIAIEDDHRAGEADKGSLRRLDRIGRAALLSLDEDLNVGIGALRSASHLVHAGADHHADLADRGALGGVQHMNEHRRAGDGNASPSGCRISSWCPCRRQGRWREPNSASCLFDQGSAPGGFDFAGSNRGPEATVRALSNGKPWREP